MTRTLQKRRYNPKQSRSLQTAIALQDAFVRLLRERGYGHVAIRDIVELAGVGLGTFYEHYANADELARACLHFRTQQILAAITARRGEVRGKPLEDVVGALLDTIIALHEPTPERWSVYYLLQRQYTDQPTYQRIYESFIAPWAGALRDAADWPPNSSAEEAASVIMTILHGLVPYAFLARKGAIDLSLLRRQLRDVVFGYIARFLKTTVPATN
jgi:AcrR family transcriptional regulator